MQFTSFTLFWTTTDRGRPQTKRVLSPPPGCDKQKKVRKVNNVTPSKISLGHADEKHTCESFLLFFLAFVHNMVETDYTRKGLREAQQIRVGAEGRVRRRKSGCEVAVWL